MIDMNYYYALMDVYCLGVGCCVRVSGHISLAGINSERVWADH